MPILNCADKNDYNDAEAHHILKAYRLLFPSISDTLANYWKLNNKNISDWSYLTTDFHSVNLSQIRDFDREVRAASINAFAPDKIAKYYCKLASKHNRGLGYSLGISPWTDDLLLRTFDENKTSGVITILGHDWYPIVTVKNGKAQFEACPPLKRYSIYDPGWERYADAIPKVKENYCILFLNLYPHFRDPCTSVKGSLGDDKFYDDLVGGFEALCNEIPERFHIKGIISWGVPVLKALAKRTDLKSYKGLMKIVKSHNGIPLELSLNKATYNYYPFAHPSFPSNFKKNYHLTAFENACSRLTNLK